MITGTIEIVVSSFKMAIQELWKNKLRTFLSLFGITIGIFCIIGVLATVNSLEQNIQNEIKSLGNNTIYIDKWEYSGGGPDYPWWKFVNRPSPSYKEVQEIRERTPLARYVAFHNSINDPVDFAGRQLSGVTTHSINEDFRYIQPAEIAFGRAIADREYEDGAHVAVIGNEIAEQLFGQADLGVDKIVEVRGKQMLVIGIIKKQGKGFLSEGGWDFDKSIFIPYRFGRTLMNELKADPLIMVQGKEGVSSKSLKEELTGTMRAVRKLTPTQDDNFALNDINDFSKVISDLFVNVNIGGWAIALLSLIVGMFGVANIMFVSVRERTSQIGLKKAIGAKSRIILTEFLLESSFLCIIGGLIGLTLVFLLTQILTSVLNFPVFISTYNMLLAIGICIVVGVIAGFIPARQAARMDPVVAIRSK
ncbi:MAG: FtsX-like permease family protein [Chitinophagia bacterium]|nr:FtsX-like permease family protein [Chitinophagia bacterium]